MCLISVPEMGRKYKYFPPPPPEIEEMHWLDVPNRRLHLITKLEPVDKAEWLIHCIDDDGCIVGIFGCPHKFLREIKEVFEFKFNVDVQDRGIYFITKGIQGYDVFHDLVE